MSDVEWEVVCDRLGISPDHGILIMEDILMPPRDRGASRVRGLTVWDDLRDASLEEKDVKLERRKCTDPLFCAVFVLFWIGMILIAALALENGEPGRLLYGNDALGHTCGIGAMAGKKHTYYPRLQKDLALYSVFSTSSGQSYTYIQKIVSHKRNVPP